MAMAREGADVAIEAVRSANPVDADQLTAQGVAVHYSRERFHSPLRISPELKRRTRSLQADIFHGHGLWQVPVHDAMRSGRRRGIPSVLSPRGMLEPGAMQFARVKKRLAALCFQWRDLQSAACLHATAEAEAATLRARGLRAPICVIPNAIELPAISDITTTAPDPNRVRRIGFLSRIHPKKGLPLLLDAWHQLQSDFPNWQLEIAGTDEAGHEKTLQRKAASLGIATSVHFHGPLFGAAKTAFLRDIDLFVLPTRSENFGIVVAESLAHGTPAITTREAPWARLETHNAGWWIALDPTALVQSLRHAMQLPDAERHAMGQSGRQLVDATFSTRTVGQHMLAVYNWLTQSAPCPPWVHRD